MQIAIAHPAEETWIFSALLVIVCILTASPKSGTSLTKRTTTELKGFSILAVILAHIGYYLATDPSYLFPLSILGGVGLNIFLFLSGYGLTLTSLAEPYQARMFVWKRFRKIYIPFWLALVPVLVCDATLLNVTYPPTTILQSVLGFFPTANLYTDINSPLWYFTFISGLYVLFSIIFRASAPLRSGLVMLGIASIIVMLPLPVGLTVAHLYRLHALAFPLGMIAAALTTRGFALSHLIERLRPFERAAVTVLLLVIIGFTALHANVGETAWREETASLITTFAIILLFLLKPFEIRLFTILGKFSYEIYLLHWPILYRYDVLFALLPASTATFGGLIILILLGALLQTLAQKISSTLSFTNSNTPYA